MHQDDCFRLLIELRPPGSPHHLKHVGDGVVHVALRLPVVELGSLEDNEVRGQVDSPSQRGGAHQHLDFAIGEQTLAERTVSFGQSRVVETDAEGEGVLQFLGLYLSYQIVHLGLADGHELTRTLVGGGTLGSRGGRRVFETIEFYFGKISY